MGEWKSCERASALEFSRPGRKLWRNIARSYSATSAFFRWVVAEYKTPASGQRCGPCQGTRFHHAWPWDPAWRRAGLLKLAPQLQPDAAAHDAVVRSDAVIAARGPEAGLTIKDIFDAHGKRHARQQAL